MVRGYIYLVCSIVLEVTGTAFLKVSDGFTNPIPSLLLVVFYGLSFVIFIFALRTISLSIGYSIWAGLGTAGTALVGIFAFKETLSIPNFIGLFVIIVGIIVMNTSKKAEEKTETTVTST